MDLVLRFIPYRKHFFGFLIVITCFPNFLPAQSIFEQIGRLPVTTYTAEEYDGAPVVLSAIQSEEGLMYFGTSEGIHEYDGVSWRALFDRVNFRSIRGFAKDPSGRIFYAGTDFGYLETDTKGETKAVSLLHLIPEELRTNFLAYEIHYLNGYILLRTLDHHLIRLEFGEDFTLKSLKSWQVETRFGTSFVMENNFYVRQADKGLYRLEGDEIKLIPGTEFFGKEPLAIMLPYLDSNENQLLLGSPFSGFYLFDGTSVSKFPTQVDQLIKEGAGRLLHALAYQGNYILSFTGAGIVIMNPKGELLNRIGTEQGLPTDVVRNVYLDRGQGLWATTEDGIARISIGSPIQTFGKDLGITSFVSSIQKQGKDFYLGTSNGLVKFDQKINAFKSVPGYNTFGSGFLNFDGQDLIVANGPSLEVITAGKTIKLDFPKDGSIPFSTLIPKHNPNFLLVGTTTGLLVYERGLSKEFPWELKGKAPEIGPTEFLFEGKDGRIFTSGAGKINALRIEENKLESKGALPIKSKAFEVSTSSPFSLIEGEFYVRSSEGFQKFSEKEQDFLPTDDFEAVEAEIRDFNQFNTGIIWAESKAGKKFVLKRNEAGKFVKDDTPNSIAPYLTWYDFIDEDSILWFGSQKGLVRYDPKKDNQSDKEFFTLIRRIETKTDTLPLPFYGRKKDVPAVERKDNSYRFEFAAPYFEDEKKTKYQTYLEGFEADWVDWNDNRFKEYTNLAPGTYTFHVRAQAFTGRVSEEAVFSFVVLPPWYATWWAYLIYALLIFAVITAIVKWRSRKLKAENRILEERVNERTAALEKSIEDLKSTQAQLIQSEKMASLGELTAGIAHEIQNPLNFVNNFSEVNGELLVELKEELVNGNLQEADTIVNDLIENESKINHHGKRADAIVKGMLQHSRSSSGEKELTDVNALADEYLRLSYHGLRAKDKGFKADFNTEFDPHLPKIHVVPQDMGRVLLNLINNAFQACNELNEQDLSGFENLTGLTPTVTVSTKNLGNKIEISVSDNGPGIPDAIKDKIFQPFFTTKPTGQGTGLGLSLSYDIVKAHGGDISLESQEGLGTTFHITLPI